MSRLTGVILFVLLVCFGVFGEPLPRQSSSSGAQSSPPATITVPATVVTDKADSPSASGSPSIPNALDLYRSGKLDEAEQEYRSLISANPESAGAYAGLARVYLKEKKISDALTAANKAVAVSSHFDDGHVALGEVYFRQGKLYEAEQEFIALVRANTDDARAYLGMARVSKANSYYKQAKRMLDKAAELDPEDPEVLREEFTFGVPGQPRKGGSVLVEVKRQGAKDVEEGTESHPPSDKPVVVQLNSHSERMCRLVSKVTSMQSKLKLLLDAPGHIAGYGLDVGFNGTRATLRVDTGAGGILVTRGVAEKAGMKHLFDNKVRGIGDNSGSQGYFAMADSIRIGDLEFEHCPIQVIEKNPLKDVDGLIGGDVFEDFLVDLNFPDSKMGLSQLPPIPGADPSEPAALQSEGDEPHYYDRYVAPEMKDYTPVSRFGHMLLVPTHVNNLPAKLFLIDTGMFGNTISPAAAREVTGISGDSDTYVKGLSGNVKTVFRANELTLTFGHLRQKNEDMVAFDISNLSDNVGTEISGILGSTMLAMLEMKIDYRDGLVDFIYDSHRIRMYR